MDRNFARDNFLLVDFAHILDLNHVKMKVNCKRSTISMMNLACKRTECNEFRVHIIAGLIVLIYKSQVGPEIHSNGKLGSNEH
jgi:hypothetical protein